MNARQLVDSGENVAAPIATAPREAQPEAVLPDPSRRIAFSPSAELFKRWLKSSVSLPALSYRNDEINR